MPRGDILRTGVQSYAVRSSVLERLLEALAGLLPHRLVPAHALPPQHQPKGDTFRSMIPSPMETDYRRPVLLEGK